ncbi:MAG: amino acid ABC transporter ATP-binding protein [Firmicutes bacterium]|nr:amino acid ABC transporter ATP-binding protein [Bacillota bacterium]
MLHARNITKDFIIKNKKKSNPTVIQALKGIDLQVNKSEVVVIIGTSGGGKSTLLRCLNLLETPTSGEIVFDNNIIDSTQKNINEIRQKIGFVFQNFNLFANKTILKNLTLAPSLHNKTVSKAEIDEQAIVLLSKFGLQDKAHVYPSNLSGGQKQRVAIVRALMLQPQIMLFDEPTSALDPELVQDVLNAIKTLQQEGMTMVIVTHEMSFAKAVATKVVFVDNGLIVEQGSSQEIFDYPKSDRLKDFLSKTLAK